MPNDLQQVRPVDRSHWVRIICFVLGVGSLLPWNFFIIASQYFHKRLAGNTTYNTTFNTTYNTTFNTTFNTTSGGGDYDSWMPLASHLPLVIVNLLNCLLHFCRSGRVLPATLCSRSGRVLPATLCSRSGRVLPADRKVVSSMVLIIASFFLTAFLVKVKLLPGTFFYITMATIVFINMFNGVLVGSLLGVVSLLSEQNLPWFMGGQGGSGVFAAVVMFISIKSGEVDACVYFITPCVVTGVTLVCYLWLVRTQRGHTRDTRGDAPQEPPGSTEMQALSSSEAPEEGGDPTRDEDQERHSCCRVLKKIGCMAACVTGVFAVTLSVFPVITSRVQTVYKHNADWDKLFTCVCCFGVFNVMDLLGRFATCVVQWPSKESRWLPVAAVSRVVFVPLLVMCNVQDSKFPVFFRSDCYFVFFMALFSFSSGYLASLCVAYAPQLVPGEDGEAAGLLMGLFIAVGLSLGALLSSFLKALVD